MALQPPIMALTQTWTMMVGSATPGCAVQHKCHSCPFVAEFGYGDYDERLPTPSKAAK